MEKMTKVTFFGVIWFLFNVSSLLALGLANSYWELEPNHDGTQSSISLFGDVLPDTGSRGGFTIVTITSDNDRAPNKINTLAGTWRIFFDNKKQKYIIIASPQFSNGTKVNFPDFEWELQVNSDGEAESLTRSHRGGRRVEIFERSAQTPYYIQRLLLDGRQFVGESSSPDSGTTQLMFFSAQSQQLKPLRWQLTHNGQRSFKDEMLDPDEYGEVFAVIGNLVYLKTESGRFYLYQMKTQFIPGDGVKRNLRLQLTAALHPIIPLPVELGMPFIAPSSVSGDDQVPLNEVLLLNTVWTFLLKNQNWILRIFPSGRWSLSTKMKSRKPNIPEIVITHGTGVSMWQRIWLSLNLNHGRILLLPSVDRSGTFSLTIDENESGPIPKKAVFKLIGRQEEEQSLESSSTPECLLGLKRMSGRKKT